MYRLQDVQRENDDIPEGNSRATSKSEGRKLS